MSEEQNTNQEVGNIFDDFSLDESLKKEVEKQEEVSKRDIFYYIWKSNIFLVTINIFLLLLSVVFFGYIFVQRSEEPGVFSFLEPLCSVFVGRDDIYSSGCSSVTYSLADYKKRISEEETQQVEIVSPLLVDTYSIEDFLSSRRASFALDTSISRLRPLEILEAFDTLQEEFAPIDKLEVSCPNIVVKSNLRLELDCISYSSDWDRGLNQLEDGILRQSEQWGGTSISKAANFMDFIENSPGSQFRIVERPTTFTSDDVQFGQYTKKTSFRFTLEYQSEALVY